MKFVSKKYKANVIYVFKKLETMKKSKLNILLNIDRIYSDKCR